MQQKSQSHSQTVDNLEEAIRLRAYFLYLERGCIDGHDLDDWFQATNEVMRRTPSQQNQTRAIAA